MGVKAGPGRGQGPVFRVKIGTLEGQAGILYKDRPGTGKFMISGFRTL